MAQKRKRNKKWIYWLLMLVLLTAAVVVVYLVWNSYFKDKDDGKDVQDEKVVQIESEDSDDKEEDEGEIIDWVEKEKVEQYDGDNPNDALELSGAITFAQVVDGKLMIRINIDQYLNNGSCRLIIKRNNAEIYSNTANIIDNASTATCEGFDIDANGLGAGEAELMIELDSGSKKGMISGVVNI